MSEKTAVEKKATYYQAAITQVVIEELFEKDMQVSELAKQVVKRVGCSESTARKHIGIMIGGNAVNTYFNRGTMILTVRKLKGRVNSFGL